MPIRRRANRRRSGEVEAWAGYLMSGCDFFDELHSIGLDEETAEPLAEEVWHRIGADIIAHYDEIYRGFHPPERPYWAETVFGPPGRRAGKRRR